MITSVSSIQVNCTGSIAKSAFNGISGAKSISFGSSCTEVKEGVFLDNKNITSVDLEKVKIVGKDAFSGCTSLSSVTKATSLTTIGEGAFKGTKITSFESSASYGANSFKDCVSLTTVKMGKSINVNLTAFSGCTKLVTFDISSDNTAYALEDGLLYTKDHSTLYLSPTGSSKTVTSVNAAVKTINLGEDKNTYLIDLMKLNSHEVKFESQTGSNATGIAYSSMGLKDASVSYTSGVFTLSFSALYDGWSSGFESATASTGKVTVGEKKLTLNVPLKGTAKMLPMGVAYMTYGDLKKCTGIGGWSLGNVMLVLADGAKDTDPVTVVKSYGGNITGYTGDGKATLGADLIHNGVKFKVDSMAAGKYSTITDLTVTDNMVIALGLFENCMKLRTVTMDHVETLNPNVFRYCTNLDSVSMKACKSIGDYAFEGCSSLKTVRLGAATVSIGTGVFNNCHYLQMLCVPDTTTLTGNPGLFVVHTDSEAVDIVLDHGNLILEGTGFASVDVKSSSNGNASTVKFYKGGMASVFVGDMDQVYLKFKAGQADSKCLIVLDTRLDYSVNDLIVDSGSTLKDLPNLSRDGYIFKGWMCNGTAVSSTTTVTSSMVLEAQWEKENTPDNTSMYVIAAFAAAVIGSVAILFVNSRR